MAAGRLHFGHQAIVSFSGEEKDKGWRVDGEKWQNRTLQAVIFKIQTKFTRNYKTKMSK